MYIIQRRRRKAQKSERSNTSQIGANREPKILSSCLPNLLQDAPYSRRPDGTRTRRKGISAGDSRATTLARKHAIVVVRDAINDAVPRAKVGRFQAGDALILERLVAVELRYVGGCAAEQVDVRPPSVTAVAAILPTLSLNGAALIATLVSRIGIKVAGHDAQVLSDPVAESLLASRVSSSDIARQGAAETVPPVVEAGAIGSRIGSSQGKVGKRRRVGKHVSCACKGVHGAIPNHHAGTGRMRHKEDPGDGGELGLVVEVLDERVVNIKRRAAEDSGRSHRVGTIAPVVAVPRQILAPLVPPARVKRGIEVGGNDDALIADDIAERSEVVFEVATGTVLNDPSGGRGAGAVDGIVLVDEQGDGGICTVACLILNQCGSGGRGRDAGCTRSRRATCSGRRAGL